jgi:hypothetical protein
MLPAGDTWCLSPTGSIAGALYHKLQTQSSAPDDGRNYRPKYVELIQIINKIIIVASSWLFIPMMHGHTDIKFISPCYSSPIDNTQFSRLAI